MLHPGPRLRRYRPESRLVVEQHPVARAASPAIDFHTHLGRWLTRDGGWMAPDVGELLTLMDACNVATAVNLDGRWGDELEANLDRYDRTHPGRFVTFCHVDWKALEKGQQPDVLVKELERSAAVGARGVKVWKDLGLEIRVGGRLLFPDDPMIDPVWEAAGSLGLPVLIHVGDPLAFFLPADERNERLEYLLDHPGVTQRRHGPAHFSRLMEALEAVVARHPATTFVGAHVGGSPEDLGWIASLMAGYRNFYVDISAQAAELGRQPRAAARLCRAHPDRVLFGTDAFPLRAEDYHLYFRLLETNDEHFPYSSKPVPPSGRWAVSGLGLSGEILDRIYRRNARIVLGDEDEAGEGSGPNR
ncbi:MAG: amidohydrolase family protein [Acidimicrobiales bacterium]